MEASRFSRFSWLSLFWECSLGSLVPRRVPAAERRACRGCASIDRVPLKYPRSVSARRRRLPDNGSGSPSTGRPSGHDAEMERCVRQRPRSPRGARWRGAKPGPLFGTLRKENDDPALANFLKRSANAYPLPCTGRPLRRAFAKARSVAMNRATSAQ